MADKKKILIVDDSDLVAGMLTEYLENSGFTVLRAANGVDGIIAAYREVPDLIVMDVEMPVLQGYQASRLLKARRGVRDIPIIMHTSLSEDRDQFWARSSGADAFISKDFDNLEPLLEKVRALADHGPYNRAVIAEDGARIERDSIMEMLGTIVDQQLFQSTILNQLSGAGSCIESVQETAEQVLYLMDKVCECHVAAVLLNCSRECLAFVRPGKDVNRRGADDFLNICLDDFFTEFSDVARNRVQTFFIGVDDRPDFEKINLDAKKVSSYMHLPLTGHCDTVGTLHVGNLINNYFSDHICKNITVFAGGAGGILENSLLMKNISEMERNIRNVFSKFVPAEIIDDLVGKGKTSSLLAGEKRSVAVLFSDIRSFTEISEHNSPEEVVAFLNRYFETMTSAILHHGGTVDKYIGDAILAVFGAPTSYPDNAERAVSAAFDMLRSLAKIDTGTLRMPEIGLDMGIGIHEGDAIVGNIGSKERFDYTVIGDTVNLASRLESLTKHYSSHIIVSESVKEKLKGKILFREIDRVRVKGKEIATTIYKLENIRKNFFNEAIMTDFNKAMSMYKIKNWDTAVEYFNKVLEKIPDDYISAMYIARCRDYMKNPPADDWDGTLDLKFK